MAVYPASYPAGVFVVTSPQHLSPLVSRLRKDRRLKADHNVTVFDAARFVETGCTTQQAWCSTGDTTSVLQRSSADIIASADSIDLPAAPLHPHSRDTISQHEGPAELTLSQIKLYEMTVDEAAALHSAGEMQLRHAASCELCSLATLRGSEAGQRLLALLREPRCHRLCTSSGGLPSYMAVHVRGDFTDAELCSYLRPLLPPGSEAAREETDESSSQKRLLQQPPVAFLRGARRFHRVCCPDLQELPSALAALRRSALLQRGQYRAGCGVGESKGRHPHAPPAASASPRTQVQQRLDEGNVDFTPRSAAVPLEQEAAAFTFSELFGGIGMFRTALERVGGRATFAVEVAPPAQLVYALNHRCWHDCPAALQLPNAKSAVSCASTMEIRDAALPPLLVRDITEIPSAFFPRHDVLTGGFPCQSFAKAGAAAGLNAEKGWLFYEVVRVLAATRPAAFLLENVEHLVEVEAGAQLEEILYRLRHPTSAPAVHSFTEGKYGSADGGVEYEVRHVVIDGGVLTPQTRRRVYFFGFRKGQGEGGGNSNSSSSSAAAPHFKYPHAEESVAAGVVADALERLQQAAKTAPYRCVRDLLVVPSVKDHPVCTRDGSLRVCQQRPDDTDRCGSSLQLTPVQWEAVQRSHTFRQNPMWRVCDVNGKARTLLGSYRTSYQLYSEFIPYAPEQTLHEVLDILAMADPRAEGGSACGKTQPRCTNTTTTIAPPLRFLSIRECARLQGIDDCFCFPHEEDSTLVLSSLAKDEEEEGEVTRRLRIPPAVLRQVPSGAVYKLIGNAVNPLVVECLGSAIAAYLQRRRAG